MKRSRNVRAILPPLRPEIQEKKIILFRDKMDILANKIAAPIIILFAVCIFGSHYF